MNTLEAALHYPWGAQLPEPGRALRLAPGLAWLRMGLPFALDHINLWLLSDEVDGQAGWSVVDTCVDRQEARAQWEQLIEHELRGLPIVRVLATHMHPDHLGLAHWLCERFSAPLWISMSDYLMARLAVNQQDSFGGQATADFFVRHGMRDPQVLQEVVDRKDYYAQMVPQVPAHYRRMQDGQALSMGGCTWRCVSGYGHSPEHMALYSEDPGLGRPVLISGDMVLPRISTNISVYETEPDGNPLQLFLDSLDKFLPLPEETLVLPSHGRPFVGLHERIRQLKAHHEERLSEVMQACQSQARCAADIMPVMFKRELDVHQTTFALGESMAHLNLLWHAGQLRREVDAQGVLRFSAKSA
jgi:glyoxylase-like metal-dependent hydrolase (beta-lactamase superfamily II)